MENKEMNVNLEEMKGTAGGSNNQNTNRKNAAGYTETDQFRCPKCGSINCVLKPTGHGEFSFYTECKDCGEKFVVNGTK